MLRNLLIVEIVCFLFSVFKIQIRHKSEYYSSRFLINSTTEAFFIIKIVIEKDKRNK